MKLSKIEHFSKKLYLYDSQWAVLLQVCKHEWRMWQWRSICKCILIALVSFSFFAHIIKFDTLIFLLKVKVFYICITRKWPNEDFKRKWIDLTQSYKSFIPSENKKDKRTHKDATKTFDYTTIEDRLKTISSSNCCHPTGLVEFVYQISTFPFTAKDVYSKGHTFKHLKIILLIETKDQQPPQAEKS